MSLNESQRRGFNDKNYMSGLHDGPHGVELAVLKMASMHAGCIVLLCEEEDAIWGRIWQQIWRKFGKFNSFADICEEIS